MERMLPALPMERMLPALPIDRILQALPRLRIAAMEKRLPTDTALPELIQLSRLPGLFPAWSCRRLLRGSSVVEPCGTVAAAGRGLA
jgi:hypothetical protein